MYIQQLYTSCLAEAAYYIESEGEAAIIDPLRETTPYLRLAEERNATIRYIFETHFHADFVSGHLDLAAATGATIIFGPEAETNYDVYNAKDGEEFSLGKIRIKALHTPGHTPESTCYLLNDEDGKSQAVFTGDTLFVGDVGRPDLLDGIMTKEELAGMLYDSLNDKIKPLPDDVIVYPAHGPGSACGKNIGKETFSTIGQQKLTNYAMKAEDRERFIEQVTAGMTPPPNYFFEDARINKEGYTPIDAVLQKGMTPLSSSDIKVRKNEVVILDTRTPSEFEKGFIPGSVNIGLNGQYAVWVGTIFPISQAFIIVADPGKEEEAIVRLARVGYENVEGYLEGGIESWNGKLEIMPSIDPDSFSRELKEETNLIDVRKQGEFEAGHLEGARLHTLSELVSNYPENNNEPLYVYCAGGYRSMIACSLLRRAGYSHVINLKQGFKGLEEAGIPTTVPAVS